MITSAFLNRALMAIAYILTIELPLAMVVGS